MGKTLNISDSLYKRLELVARQKGLHTIEQLLESWQIAEDNLHKRRETVAQG